MVEDARIGQVAELAMKKMAEKNKAPKVFAEVAVAALSRAWGLPQRGNK